MSRVAQVIVSTVQYRVNVLIPLPPRLSLSSRVSRDPLYGIKLHTVK